MYVCLCVCDSVLNICTTTDGFLRRWRTSIDDVDTVIVKYLPLYVRVCMCVCVCVIFVM